MCHAMVKGTHLPWVSLLQQGANQTHQASHPKSPACSMISQTI